MPTLLSWLKEPLELNSALAVPPVWFQTEAWWRPPPPRPLQVLVERPGLLRRLAKAKAAQFSGELLVRRSAVEALLELDGVRLHAATLVDRQGRVHDDDFALVDVTAHAPLDHRASKAKWHDGFLARLLAPRWSEGRTPRAPLFRLGEALGLLVATEELAASLAKATGGLLGARKTTAKELEVRAVPTVAAAAHPALEPNDAAESAYWSNGPRRAVCASPEWAYWLATTVDHELRSDTRAALAKHPTFALMALLRLGVRDATLMKVCATHWWSAWHLSLLVERRVPPGCVRVLSGAGYAIDEVNAAAAALWR